MYDFNTSHVVVYRGHYLVIKEVLENFNTSHVVVYHNGVKIETLEGTNFNTSHVVVYRLNGEKTLYKD